MRIGNVIVIGLLVARAASSQSTGADSVPKSVRSPQYLSDIRAEVQPIYEMGELPGPLHVKRLDSAAIPRGSREIRIYAGSIGGYPATGVIVTEMPGRSPRITGRMFRYWPVNDKEFTEDVDVEARYSESEAGRCKKPVRGETAVVCDVVFTREPDWNRFLQVLDSADAWTLPDEREIPRRPVMLIHGWRIRAEAKRDTTYHLWWYDNPQIFRPPEGKNALRIMNLVYDLYDQVQLPSNVMFTRGIYLFGKDTSLFTPCSTPERSGNARGALEPVQKIVGDSSWKSRTGPVQAFDVAGWFRLTGAKTDRSWWVDTLTAVRPSSSRSCESRN